MLLTATGLDPKGLITSIYQILITKSDDNLASSHGTEIVVKLSPLTNEI